MYNDGCSITIADLTRSEGKYVAGYIQLLRTLASIVAVLLKLKHVSGKELLMPLCREVAGAVFSAQATDGLHEMMRFIGDQEQMK
jgi:hypothetical protein